MQLSVNNVCKQYASVLAVDNLSFDVKSQEIFALLGPNGAGKSSTIRMLIDLTNCDAGSINYTDNEGNKILLEGSDFGYLPEERGLFQEAKILDTLLYLGQLKGMSKNDAEAQAEEWLSRFDLIERKKDQLKTLSKGNQQKVQLISAVLHRPKIVFLDEPFSGLDPINQEKVIEFLETLRDRGTTIILSAHQMSLVEKLADRFLLMNKGKAALYGSMEDIRQHANLGNSLVITFQETLQADAFELSDELLKVEEIQPKVLRFTLAPQANLPTLLKNIMAEHAIVTLQTNQPSLHDIYIDNVKGAA